MDHYMGSHASFAGVLLGGPSDMNASELVRALLRAAVELYASDDTPKGCAMFEGGGAGSPDESEACAVTFEHKARLETLLLSRLRARAKAGDVLAAPPAVLAKSVLATMRGLSQLARDGATKRELNAVADHVAASCMR